MKKVLIAIIVLAVLAAGSITAVLLVNSSEKKKESAKNEVTKDYALFSYDKDSINHIEIDCEEGNFSADLDENGNWQTDEEGFTVSNSSIQNFYTIMSYLTAEKDYGEATPENIKVYGLENPTTIKLSNGSYECTLILGDADPTGTYYYAMTDTKSKIYAVPAMYGEQLKATRNMLVDKYITKYSVSDIDTIELKRDGETVYKFKYNPETTLWGLEGEYSGFDADSSEIATEIAYLARVEAQEMFENNLQDLSKYGFDNPVAELILTGLDGETHSYLFSSYGNNSKTYTYMLWEDNNQVGAFLSGDVDLIKKNPKDFISGTICYHSIFDVEEIEYSYEDINCNIKMDYTNKKFSLDDGNISVHDTETNNSFVDFFNSISYITLSDLDISKNPELTDPVMSVSFKEKESSDKVLYQFVTADDNTLYVFKDGSFTGCSVLRSDVIGLSGISGYYDKFIKKVG